MIENMIKSTDILRHAPESDAPVPGNGAHARVITQEKGQPLVKTVIAHAPFQSKRLL